MTPDKEQVVEPLTAEEIEDIRVRGANLALVDPRFYSLWDVINRLLATLDAARTASVAGLDANGARRCIAQASVYLASGNIIAAHDELEAALATLNSAPSIEQEPGEGPGNECPCVNCYPRCDYMPVNDGGYNDICDDCSMGNHRPDRDKDDAALREQEPGETLRAAAVALVEAMEANRDAINGGGHDGPHDRVLHHDPCTDLPGVAHVYSSTDDCAQCGGAQYGSDDDLHKATGDLRRVLGLPVRPWEERAALEADPQETER